LEWVKIIYPRTRDVYVDDELCGETNRTLAVGPGTQRIDLGTPLDYTPRRRTVTVIGTSQIRPLKVDFTPKS
jgi:hypothetical protein